MYFEQCGFYSLKLEKEQHKRKEIIIIRKIRKSVWEEKGE